MPDFPTVMASHAGNTMWLTPGVPSCIVHFVHRLQTANLNYTRILRFFASVSRLFSQHAVSTTILTHTAPALYRAGSLESLQLLIINNVERTGSS